MFHCYSPISQPLSMFYHAADNKKEKCRRWTCSASPLTGWSNILNKTVLELLTRIRNWARNSSSSGKGLVYCTDQTSGWVARGGFNPSKSFREPLRLSIRPLSLRMRSNKKSVLAILILADARWIEPIGRTATDDCCPHSFMTYRWIKLPRFFL